jgi:serine/threonine protein kinase
MTIGIGTTCWLAPEVIEHAHSSLASDVYGYGIVMWEVFTRIEVYEGLTAAQIIARVVKSGLRPKAPENCPVNSLMEKCWAQDPSKRPTFKTIIRVLTEKYDECCLAESITVTESQTN